MSTEMDPETIMQACDALEAQEFGLFPWLKNVRAIAYAYEIKIDALAKLGALLTGTPKATGGDAQRTRFHKGRESPPTLQALGITLKTSMYAQQLAALPPDTRQAIAKQEISMTEVLANSVMRPVRQSGCQTMSIACSMPIPRGSITIRGSD